MPAEAQRALLEEVDRRYLTTVPSFMAEAQRFLAERVKLALFGSLGVAAAAGSAIAATDFTVRPLMAALGFGCCALAATFAWAAHAWLETLSAQQATRQLTNHMWTMHQLFPSGTWEPVTPEKLAEDRSAPDETSARIRKMVVVSTGFVTLGASFLIGSIGWGLADPAPPAAAVPAAAASALPQPAAPARPATLRPSV